MAIIGIGTDIIEIERIKKVATARFLKRFFTEGENAMFIARNMKYEIIAGNFAAKEAFVKAIGTGFMEITPQDVEILRDDKGKPYINLYESAKQTADKYGVGHIHITISHSKEYATAFVILE